MSMTEERDERMVAALESIAVSLEKLSVPLVQTSNSATVRYPLFDPNTTPYTTFVNAVSGTETS